MLERTVLVIGLGEVGYPLYQIIKESGKYHVYGLDVDESKIPRDQGELPKTIEVVHICYPCSNRKRFIENTVEYIEEFKPKKVFI